MPSPDSPALPTASPAAITSPDTPRGAPPGVLRELLRRHPRILLVALPASVLSEGNELLIPILLGYVIDAGIVAADPRALLWGIVLLVGMRLVGLACWATGFRIVQRARMTERHRLRVQVTAAVLDPSSRPLERPAGEVLSIATSDADKASDVFEVLGWAIPGSLAVIGAGVWLTWVDPVLGLTLLVGLAAMVVMVRVVTPVLSDRYDRQQSRAADAAATATDLVHGLRVLQGLGVQARARAQYRARSRTALDAALVNARFSGVATGLTTIITSVTLAAVVLIAAQRALDGQLSLGTLIAVAAVLRAIMGFLHGLSEVPTWWAGVSTSARRVRDLLADLGRRVDDLGGLESGASAPAPRRPGTGGLTIPVAGHPVHIADGEVVALVAPDPSVVDDVLAALQGGGGATLGDRPIAAVDLTELRRDLLVEPHAVDLFDGTLRDQLATRAPAGTARDGSDDEWARQALHAAGAEDLLEILPDGFDTRILDRGANLSGGQRQRIALARAVAADPPVLVLQDPTTAVDAVTEAHIAEALVAVRRRPDRATLLLTRAPALLRAADRVVLATPAGPLPGSHTDLLERPDYAEAVHR
ncbi:ABC transporter transmembrane domain-containing protein [Brachybacterium sillae]|uniref:ABC transporter transmembrane domain-containing protein n=1 Tax=Brachybacterium sillae TaxID=2810536 RepID=UPI00217CE4A3|nr:ABC transporter ATP-binding protein [Brachybacterium sillae]